MREDYKVDTLEYLEGQLNWHKAQITYIVEKGGRIDKLSYHRNRVVKLSGTVYNLKKEIIMGEGEYYV